MAEQDEKMTDDAGGNGGASWPVRLAVIETEMRHTATKGDITNLRAEMKEDIGKVEKEIARVEKSISDLRVEMKEDIARVEKNISKAMIKTMSIFLTVLLAFLGIAVTVIIQFLPVI